MSSEDSFKLQTNYNIKKIVEEQVIKALQEKEYTLNTVNSNGENLLHISAANGCLDIIKEIFRKQDSRNIINRKNNYGWTPLMLAIRNRDIKTVKFLLEKKANVNESTYLGMSVLGLSAAINLDMFETVYQACPSALLNSTNDDITPLCIAAMKNDKKLFFKLLELGFEVSKSNEYTHIMMRRSTIPEIANLSKTHLNMDDYWNDITDNISIETDSDKEKQQLYEQCDIQTARNTKNKRDEDNENNNKLSFTNFPTQPIFVFHPLEQKDDNCNNNVTTDSKKCSVPSKESCKLNLMIKHLDPIQNSLISPTLTCTLDGISPASPNIYFEKDDYDDKINVNISSNVEEKHLIQDKTEIDVQYSKNNNCLTNLPLQRLQSIRPPDLNIHNNQEDLDITIGCITEFSPIRSSHVPPDINDENVFGENTPTPPRYKTPPRGMTLNSEEAKMFVLLKRYGLNQHIPIFLKEEVDIDLFMTLTDNDLIEIGIKDALDRKAILNVIMDYKYSMI
ncbi:uncharacterized protein LOC143347540 [Colletes latitarsis]|uniref:uncharacterized protein LOC143347540 n=1 Tax=Colletes latitarsis TaxID=2605962 RepID=UPI004035FB5B